MKNILSLPLIMAALALITLGKAAPQPNYPRYKLVVVGPLGGAASSQIAPALTLNNRGDMIAMSATAVPDPFPDTPLQDGTIWHAVLTNANAIVLDLGGLGGNHSLPFWISDSGLIGGVSQNGQFDNTVGFPQVRAVCWDSKHRIVDLGTFGGNFSYTSSINSRGQVVGGAANTVPESVDV